MILFDQNNSDYKTVTKNSDFCQINCCWDMGSGSAIYFDDSWFYEGSHIRLSAYVEIINTVAYSNSTISDICWNGGGVTSGDTMWTGYNIGTPFRGYSVLQAPYTSVNGVYYFSKDLIITKSSVDYIKNNNVIYQPLSFRIDNCQSGTIKIFNTKLETVDNTNIKIHKNNILTSDVFIENSNKLKIKNYIEM